MSALLLACERKVGRLVCLLALACLLAAVFAALWQVISRFLLESPSVWTEVVTRIALIWCVFLSLSIAFRRGALVSVNLLHDTLNGTPKKWLRRFLLLAQLGFLSLLTYVGTQMAWATRFQLMVALEIPMSYAYAAIPVGAALSCIALIANYIEPEQQELENSL